MTLLATPSSCSSRHAADAPGDGLWIGELGGVPAGAMVLGAARPYVPTVSEPEVYGEGRTERIDERYPAARR
jgi:hypothetical protein